ncbi:MAG: DUF371 domain-containing protein [Thermoproteota archaeon]
MEITEVISAYGHGNVQATHRSTLEVTKEEWLTKRGDCIIAVAADKGMNDFKPEFKKCLSRENAELEMSIQVGGVKEVVKARGDSRLILSHSTDMVVRKSDYICSRTLAVRADKAAQDLPRRLVEKLKNPKQRVEIVLTVKV